MITGLPEVEEAVLFFVANSEVAVPSGRRVIYPELLADVSPDGRLGTTMDRLRILEGRAFDPNTPDEAVVGFAAANRLGLKVGDSLSMLIAGAGEGRTTPVPVRLVGIEAGPGEYTGDTRGRPSGSTVPRTL